MDCQNCGASHLNRKTVEYAKRFFRHEENRNGQQYRTYETIPVCQDCAARIGAALFDNLALV